MGSTGSETRATKDPEGTTRGVFIAHVNIFQKVETLKLETVVTVVISGLNDVVAKCGQIGSVPTCLVIHVLHVLVIEIDSKIS